MYVKGFFHERSNIAFWANLKLWTGLSKPFQNSLMNVIGLLNIIHRGPFIINHKAKEIEES